MGETRSGLENDRFVQRDAPWGLSAISGSKPGEYRYDSSAGSESFVYVIDSGIYLEHSEFQNRAILGICLTEEPAEDSTQNSDKSHGTFVAGIIGGKLMASQRT
jgi:subtilisin family serine protease